MIIPIYNTEPWLEECLNSVCHQTLNNIEIICVNDGSTDHSLDILKKYAELDERIIVINQENEGSSKARNTGLKCAKGNYVYFLDSDDFIDGDALGILVREMKARDLEMLFFNANVIAEDGVDKHFEQREADYFRRIHEYPPKCKGDDLYRLFGENKEYIVSACMILTDRHFLLRNSVHFRKALCTKTKSSFMNVCCSHPKLDIWTDFYITEESDRVHSWIWYIRTSCCLAHSVVLSV